MDIENFIKYWLIASNNFDAENYLQMYNKDAVLDDPSVGKKFAGHERIREYFESYFINYNTQTRLIHLTFKEDKAHLEVEFTGNFPEGKLGGIFDLTFKESKIARAKADLI